MSNESTKIIETMAAELEHLRPMEASLEMVEADVKAYKQRVADLEKDVTRLQQYHDTEATKWLAENQKLKDENARIRKSVKNAFLEHGKKEAESFIKFAKNIRHQKYKRCVAIARFCEIAADYSNEQRGHCRYDEQDYAEIYYKIFKRKRKWSQIWNSLAEKFKEK